MCFDFRTSVARNNSHSGGYLARHTRNASNITVSSKRYCPIVNKKGSVLSDCEQKGKRRLLLMKLANMYEGRTESHEQQFFVK